MRINDPLPPAHVTRGVAFAFDYSDLGTMVLSFIVCITSENSPIADAAKFIYHSIPHHLIIYPKIFFLQTRSVCYTAHHQPYAVLIKKIRYKIIFVCLDWNASPQKVLMFETVFNF